MAKLFAKIVTDTGEVLDVSEDRSNLTISDEERSSCDIVEVDEEPADGLKVGDRVQTADGRRSFRD